MYKKYTSNWIAYCYAGITFLSVPLSAFNLIEPYRRIAEGSHNRALYRSAVQVASVLAKTEAEEKKKLLNLIDGIDTLSKNAQDNNPQALDQLIGLIENHVIPIQLPPNTIVPPENATDEQIQAFQKELIQFVPAQEYSAQLVAGMPPYKYYASQENRGDRIKPNMNQKGWPCRGSQTNATVLNDCITYSQQAAMRLNHLKKEIAIFDKGIDFLNLPRDIYRQKYEKIQARLEEIDREQTVTDSTIIAEENVDAKARQQRLQQRLVRSKEIVQKEEKELKDVLDALEPFSDTEINDQKQELLKLKAEHIKHVNELQHGLQELGSIALRVQDKIYKPWLKDLEQWSHMVRHTLNTTKDMNALVPFDNEPKKAIEKIRVYTNEQLEIDKKLAIDKWFKVKINTQLVNIKNVQAEIVKKQAEYQQRDKKDLDSLAILGMHKDDILKALLKVEDVRSEMGWHNSATINSVKTLEQTIRTQAGDGVDTLLTRRAPKHLKYRIKNWWINGFFEMDVTEKTLRSAYIKETIVKSKKIALKFHPDKLDANSDRFCEITDAKERIVGMLKSDFATLEARREAKYEAEYKKGLLASLLTQHNRFLNMQKQFKNECDNHTSICTSDYL